MNSDIDRSDTFTEREFNPLENSAERILRGGRRSIEIKREEDGVNVQNYSLSDTDNLAFVEANDFMPPMSLWTKLGGIFMVGSIGVAIVLSAFTPYNVTVQAQAKIRPAGELRIVEAETEGKVVEIAVKENQEVKKGDLIASIDDSRLQTEKSQLQSNIQQAFLQLRQIEAQISAQENRIESETMGMNIAIASAEEELARTRREYQDRKNTADAEVAEAIANLRSIQEEANQAQTELISLQANLKSAQFGLNTAKAKRDRYEVIANSGAFSQNQLEESQLDVEQKEQEAIAKQAAIQRQNQELLRQKQAIAAARARLNNSKVALNPTQAEIAIAIEKIQQQKAIGQSNLSNLQKEKEALIQQQIEIEQQQARDRQELQQRAKDLEKTAIKATADGIVFKLNLRNNGQTVTLGEEIAQIAPTNSYLVIKALVPAQEIEKVAIDRQVQMKVSACPYPDYGTLKGQVSNISPDSIPPQDFLSNSNNSAVSSQNLQAGFYEVTIEPQSSVLGKGKNQCKIQIGMEGKANIIAREETVLQFLLRKARLIGDF
jgi:multidrug efflux pump subunit AcrA (membrane-fusion protein)